MSSGKRVSLKKELEFLAWLCYSLGTFKPERCVTDYLRFLLILPYTAPQEGLFACPATVMQCERTRHSWGRRVVGGPALVLGSAAQCERNHVYPSGGAQ